MANIKIADLHPAGYELFSDSETYMSQLSSHETGSIRGGGFLDDWGDLVGGAVTLISVGSALLATPASSTWGCSLAGVAFGYQGVKETYD